MRLALWVPCFEVWAMFDSFVAERVSRRVCACACLVFALGHGVGRVEARIGDSPEQMAARMLQPNLGRNFTWPKDMNPREREKALKENPLTDFAHLLPTSVEDWREQIYWKSALAQQLSTENGWRVHVYFLKGRSVLELYRRVGLPLNDFEVNAILARVRGGQTWRRATKQEIKAAEKTADTESVIGYEYELGGEDGATLRARRQGDWMILFHKRFDDYLVARKARWDETEGLRKAQQASEQEKAAPVSVEGF